MSDDKSTTDDKANTDEPKTQSGPAPRRSARPRPHVRGKRGTGRQRSRWRARGASLRCCERPQRASRAIPPSRRRFAIDLPGQARGFSLLLRQRLAAPAAGHEPPPNPPAANRLELSRLTPAAPLTRSRYCASRDNPAYAPRLHVLDLEARARGAEPSAHLGASRRAGPIVSG